MDIATHAQPLQGRDGVSHGLTLADEPAQAYRRRTGRVQLRTASNSGTKPFALRSSETKATSLRIASRGDRGR